MCWWGGLISWAAFIASHAHLLSLVLPVIIFKYIGVFFLPHPTLNNITGWVIKGENTDMALACFPPLPFHPIKPLYLIKAVSSPIVFTLGCWVQSVTVWQPCHSFHTVLCPWVTPESYSCMPLFIFSPLCHDDVMRGRRLLPFMLYVLMLHYQTASCSNLHNLDLKPTRDDYILQGSILIH